MNISQMLQPENIQCLNQITDWEEAIRISVKPLYETGYVEERYADEIINATKRMGPYYVLTDDVALIHGRPEDGVIDSQIAITVVREPVIFSPETFPARLLVTLAAEDANSHIETMQVLAHIFMDQEKINQIINASNTEEIYNLFTQQPIED